MILIKEFKSVLLSSTNQEKNNNSKSMIEDRIVQKPPRGRKTSLCRFFLRGLCIFSPHDCQFSHGIWDLKYDPWQEGEQIDYNYSQVKNDVQKQVIKGPREYINLYDYQKEKLFTLEELNEVRESRVFVRNQMHQQLFMNFMEMLCCYYPDAKFTQSFLVREYTRVGFNKIMSEIKITHINSFVCDVPSSQFYMIKHVLPPFAKKEVNFIYPKASDEQHEMFYSSAYEELIEEGKKDEGDIKKGLFNIQRPSPSIMPLNLYLKQKKMNFINFTKLIANQQLQIVMEADEQTLLKTSYQYLTNQINQNCYSTWGNVFAHVNSQHKVNNANVTNPLKPLLMENGFMFLYFPMMQLITDEKRIIEGQFPETVCDCEYQEMPDEGFMQLLDYDYQVPPKQSVDIYNMQTLLKNAPSMLNSKILGVDLEGRLRKGGYIEMVQLNNGINTFLLDIYRMHLNGDMDCINMSKKVLRHVLCNKKIKKVFHDCRHDSLALHEVMQTCIINIFDTSAIETVRGQLQKYKSEDQSPHKYKHILKQIINVKTAGLNEILHKYHAPHGINKNKDWFHQLWKKGIVDLFEKRPLDPEYRDYVVKDVLDLPHVFEEMSDNLGDSFTNWISAHYVRAGYQYTLEEK